MGRLQMGKIHKVVHHRKELEADKRLQDVAATTRFPKCRQQNLQEVEHQTKMEHQTKKDFYKVAFDNNSSNGLPPFSYMPCLSLLIYANT